MVAYPTSQLRTGPDPKKFLAIGLAAICGLFVLIFGGKIFQNVDADEIVCIQSPVSGKLKWHTTAGVKWQGFGKVTTYYKLSTYEFAVPVRFNDGGHGTLEGSLNYKIPLDPEHLTQLQTEFGNQEAVQKQLVETVTDKCVYMTGPLMSSKESYAEKRTDLIRNVEDQIMNGVYKTTQKEVKTKDPMTGADKTITVVEILQGPEGPLRQEDAVLAGYGIQVSNFAVKRLPYDEAVEGQIKQQQDLTMKVQTAIASAKEAEQRAITVAKEGEANAAKAKWEQEVIKAKAVTEAQQNLEVADLDARTASAEKRANILRGEGEAERKRLVMNADGALDKKLETYLKVAELQANALKEFKGNMVPSVVIGGNGKTPAGTDILQLLGVQAARDLAIKMDMAGADKTE